MTDTIRGSFVACDDGNAGLEHWAETDRMADPNYYPAAEGDTPFARWFVDYQTRAGLDASQATSAYYVGVSAWRAALASPAPQVVRDEARVVDVLRVDGSTHRYDLTPAQVEGKLRDALIDLGWTPPARRGGDVSDFPTKDRKSLLAVTALLAMGAMSGPVFGERAGRINHERNPLPDREEQQRRLTKAEKKRARKEATRARLAAPRDGESR